MRMTSAPLSEFLSTALSEALALETRRAYAEAARLLDEALTRDGQAPASLRFQALVLRTDIAVSLNDLGEGRGILAEARQIRLSAGEREALAADMRRADDLEAFFTHRGCAG
jgi:hypothetical protein